MWQGSPAGAGKALVRHACLRLRVRIPYSSFYLSVLAGVLACLMLTGCCGLPISGRDGTVHHLIIGIGVVSVPKPGEGTPVTAVRSHVLGIDLAGGPAAGFRAGYSFNADVFLPRDADNVCAEISGLPFGKMEVNQCGVFYYDYHDKKGGQEDVE